MSSGEPNSAAAISRAISTSKPSNSPVWGLTLENRIVDVSTPTRRRPRSRISAMYDPSGKSRVASASSAAASGRRLWVTFPSLQAGSCRDGRRRRRRGRRRGGPGERRGDVAARARAGEEGEHERGDPRGGRPHRYRRPRAKRAGDGEDRGEHPQRHREHRVDAGIGRGVEAVLEVGGLALDQAGGRRRVGRRRRHQDALAALDLLPRGGEVVGPGGAAGLERQRQHRRAAVVAGFVHLPHLRRRWPRSRRSGRGARTPAAAAGSPPPASSPSSSSADCSSNVS